MINININKLCVSGCFWFLTPSEVVLFQLPPADDMLTKIEIASDCFLALYHFVYLSIYLLIDRYTYIRTYVPAYLHTYIPTYLPPYLPACLPAYIHTYAMFANLL